MQRLTRKSDFNPRSREGSDTVAADAAMQAQWISIHAPAKGATQSFLQCQPQPTRFQSTLPRRERPVTTYSPFFSKTLFQSTLPRRERRTVFIFHLPFQKFQSTLPRRERHFLGSIMVLHLIFQSTLPRRERLFLQWKFFCINTYFNPRSREGSDGAIYRVIEKWNNFNPRSREGSDCLDQFAHEVRNNFNPRSREGSD